MERTDARQPRSLAPLWGSMLRSIFPKCVRAEEIPQSATPAAEAPDVAPKAAEPTLQFEMFSREWQQTSMQDNWDGFRIEAQNKVTDQLQATHALFLGTQLRECGYIYQFGPAFQSVDGRTMLVARYGLDGGVNARAVQRVGKSWELKAMSNSSLKDPQRNMHEGSVEYTGPHMALAGKLSWQGAWLWSGALSRKILPSLQLGGDLTLVAVNGVTSIGQIGLRYAEGKDAFTASLSRSPDQKTPGSQAHECRLQYVRKVTDRLALGSEFKYSYPDKESGLQLAYEYSFRQARVQGLLDTDGKVSCCVQDFTGFGFSGMIDYARGDYKFGVMMHVLPPPEAGQQ
eukprot:CAMPEP_0197628694 /NCGR_PEP_ID=MMETSP1338-20131121/6887_1 /TAXON_ID=43686 ORGANISM="Pelagodinium beii, Strain RCC1491" /NCGR_SAMPLE_ID=MMETSP1338 /ASSEMBLY_ACC=CAM_ASM_000754 /LENGTH=342 /DNA_ID=CAMNT_0043199685 /DNA_START=50 /DNA_END=1078 /DNA_ORIENTATION=+